MKMIRETFDLSNREIIQITIGAVLVAPVFYWGTIVLFGLLYAATGVR